MPKETYPTCIDYTSTPFYENIKDIFALREGKETCSVEWLRLGSGIARPLETPRRQDYARCVCVCGERESTVREGEGERQRETETETEGDG